MICRKPTAVIDAQFLPIETVSLGTVDISDFIVKPQRPVGKVAVVGAPAGAIVLVHFTPQGRFNGVAVTGREQWWPLTGVNPYITFCEPLSQFYVSCENPASGDFIIELALSDDLDEWNYGR